MRSIYTKYSADQIDKIGNTLIYLAEHCIALSKTKALKLLYLLDEIAVKNSGIPFLNLRYEVWKFGPVDQDIYIELSSHPNLLKPYINRSEEGGKTYISAKKDFSDDEFSDYDMELLDRVVGQFGKMSSRDLVAFTHKKESPWYKLAKKYNLLEALENEEINSTELEIDLGTLIQHDARKTQLFEDYKQSH